jgi:adenine-specific DNA-methyltransferase
MMTVESFSVERLRVTANESLDPERKVALGQFFTPARIAEFMAFLFAPTQFEQIRLLDAGAGTGMLTAAFLERCFNGEIQAQSIDVTAYEIDSGLIPYLEELLRHYHKRAKQAGLQLHTAIAAEDFIEDAVDRIQFWNTQAFTHAILNPPYKKIHSQSQHRKSIRAVGIETVNLYAAFLALAIELMADQGEIVVIIPRSFCNGPYYKPFRDLLLRKTAIQHIHLFGDRDKAFSDDEVLQENVVLHLIKAGRQETVTISTSKDETFADYVVAEYPFDQIVFSDDPEQFIRIPNGVEQQTLEESPRVRYGLTAVAVEVATGPVVDFRLSDYLRFEPGCDTVPLLYPAHFTVTGMQWPNLAGKKPNALVLCTETQKWLLPSGFYVVVRRFSSKEERRRIVAYVVDPLRLTGNQIGFENHLNVFHQNRQGLPELLSYGLATYLNSTVVDAYFRRFSGHTQVNATDLRQLLYPDQTRLFALGEWAKANFPATQHQIDQQVAAILWPNTHAWTKQ